MRARSGRNRLGEALLPMSRPPACLAEHARAQFGQGATAQGAYPDAGTNWRAFYKFFHRSDKRPDRDARKGADDWLDCLQGNMLSSGTAFGFSTCVGFRWECTEYKSLPWSALINQFSAIRLHRSPESEMRSGRSRVSLVAEGTGHGRDTWGSDSPTGRIGLRSGHGGGSSASAPINSMAPLCKNINAPIGNRGTISKMAFRLG